MNEHKREYEVVVNIRGLGLRIPGPNIISSFGKISVSFGSFSKGNLSRTATLHVNNYTFILHALYLRFQPRKR